ncbi:MAG: PEP-CTERM sorting domain-containing protein [Proteobacteria bacterium]|nr:PEP-CTERM sorting domain-containing protein [Pseudomonadota bacterium]
MNKITAIVIVVALVSIAIVGLQNDTNNCCNACCYESRGVELNATPEQIILRDFLADENEWHDIPEPGTLSMLLVGIVAMTLIKRIEK